jgi:heme-degrading monooxygenase HmoA
MTARAERQLAQVNIGRSVAPIDSAQLRGFVEQLEPVNALADAAPGFVWRLQTEEGNATAVRVFDDDGLIMNMSVWQSLDALAAFVFGHQHAQVMRRRREWFIRLREAYTALWWVPAGTIPTLAAAEPRLVSLREHGPTPYAFTFRQPFAPTPAEPAPDTSADWLCGV